MHGGGLALGREVHLFVDLECLCPKTFSLLLHLLQLRNQILLFSKEVFGFILQGLLLVLVGLNGGQQLLSLFQSLLEDLVESIDF